VTATQDDSIVTSGPTYVDNGQAEPSEWQKKIAGEWVSTPSLFDADGVWQAYENVERASEFVDGKTRYWMKTELEGTGRLRNRFELGAHFDFGVIDSDENRVYMGPDFFGTGQPYGLFVDSHYYSPGWQVDLRTWNLVLPDLETQVYSSVLHDGWSVCGVFNGIYKKYEDASAPEVQADIAAWKQRERTLGPRPHVLPSKQRGQWKGVFEVYDVDQTKRGDMLVTIDHQPQTLTRARQTIRWEGALERSYTIERTRNSANHTFEGPDAWGNGRAYGRTLFTSLHFGGGDVWKLKGRDFLMDETNRLACAWELFRGDSLTHVVYGVLDWEAAA
jgi:hypothetical protein